ncbi:hypothetical protein EPD60_11415 [Flaviaesturariibacter flavus]|uniref:DUF4595 domain-containing protein n=1 Tax=Flaviaesturariibacter flavus TaxID=2502780 RepID=A0A4R1BC60_9BACT|nr:hypothetical protein [Flaviaesturariibacter flavus]TCJ14584.1 hypothetical protein EPD60_11415 [Flaviaesturariibacter flavus]
MRSFLLAALVLLAAVSCRRLTDSTSPAVYAAPQLAYVYTVDSTSGRSDTVNRQSITYDAQGRTLEIVDLGLNRAGDTAHFVRRHFEYGTDTLAARSIVYWHYYGSGGYQRFDTITYRHENGVLVYDSSRLHRDNGDVETRVRRRTYHSSYIADTVLLVAESGGVADTTHQESRSWLTRVGLYTLRQLDSVQEWHNTPDLFYHRYDLNITPSVVPNPFYGVYKMVGDELADHYLSVYSSVEFSGPTLPAQTSSDYHYWAAGQVPVSGGTETVQYRPYVRADGFPVRITEIRGGGGVSQTVHHLLVYN